MYFHAEHPYVGLVVIPALIVRIFFMVQMVQKRRKFRNFR